MSGKDSGSSWFDYEFKYPSYRGCLNPPPLFLFVFCDDVSKMARVPEEELVFILAKWLI